MADPYARPSVGLRIRDDGPGDGSVIGGAPRTAAFRWPTYDGEPMLLLAQIDCAEAAPLLGAAWPFPPHGYLLFFHDEQFAAGFDQEHGDDGCRVLHLDAAGEALSAGVYEEVRALLPTPRYRLLGWCDHDTPRPGGLRPLLQVEAEQGTAWGEVVNVSFWIGDDDLRAGRLDGVRRSYETA